MTTTIQRMVNNIAEAVLEEVPGATTIHTVLTEVQRRRHERLGREYLKRVSLLLAEKAGSQVGTLVLDKQHEEWAGDAVDRGRQAILQAIDPMARMCITALVAEYLHAARAPDREYRRAVSLFADVTHDDLPALKQIVDTALVVLGGMVPGWVTSVESVRADEPTARIWTKVSPDRYEEQEFSMPAGFVSAAHGLVRHGFARAVPSNPTMISRTDQQYAVFDRDAQPGLQVLATCLAILPERT